MQLPGSLCATCVTDQAQWAVRGTKSQFVRGNAIIRQDAGWAKPTEARQGAAFSCPSEVIDTHGHFDVTGKP